MDIGESADSKVVLRLTWGRHQGHCICTNVNGKNPVIPDPVAGVILSHMDGRINRFVPVLPADHEHSVTREGLKSVPKTTDNKCTWEVPGFFTNT